MLSPYFKCDFGGGEVKWRGLNNNLVIYLLMREAIQLPIRLAENFLYNSRGLGVISLLVKHYVPLAHINKVKKLLKFKSAMNLQCY